MKEGWVWYKSGKRHHFKENIFRYGKGGFESACGIYAEDSEDWFVMDQDFHDENNCKNCMMQFSTYMAAVGNLKREQGKPVNFDFLGELKNL